MEKPKKYEERLMDTLGFDEDDLDANQSGHFSAAQRTKFAAEQRRIATFIAADLLVGAAWIGAAQFFWLAAATLPLLFYILMPLFAVVLLGYGIKIFRLWRDVQEDQVLSAEGRIDLSMYAQTTNNLDCKIKVGEVTFPVKRDTFLAFKNGDPYAVYYTRRSKKLISAEWLRGDDNLLSPDEIAALEDEPDDEIAPEATDSPAPPKPLNPQFPKR